MNQYAVLYSNKRQGANLISKRQSPCLQGLGFTGGVGKWCNTINTTTLTRTLGADSLYCSSLIAMIRSVVVVTVTQRCIRNTCDGRNVPPA